MQGAAQSGIHHRLLAFGTQSALLTTVFLHSVRNLPYPPPSSCIRYAICLTHHLGLLFGSDVFEYLHDLLGSFGYGKGGSIHLFEGVCQAVVVKRDDRLA